MSDISTAVLAILKKQLNDVYCGEHIPLDENLTNMGLDSMRSISLLLELESSFGLIFPDELINADTFSTAGRLISLVEQLTVRPSYAHAESP